MQTEGADETGDKHGTATVRRWLLFNIVGGLGILVQLAVLTALDCLVGVDYLAATAVAVEAAVLHNFVWHERWTWAERARGRTTGMIGRLARFHLTNGLLSLVGNLLLMKVFVGFFGLNHLPANLLSIAICSMFNFLAADRFVFLPSRLGG